MNTLQCLAVSSILLFANGSAFADAHLTPQQCDDYPFKRPVGEVTHAQLMQELAELQAAGYSGRDDNAYYPNDLQQAEATLQAEYKRDCLQLRQPD
ncbi:MULTISPECIES: DUF4148 domain-containing protein [unclassified Caballeronia]|uniref:DUF4148 domain-containing protein n=1 Tax=unclassified Caballeronia TaxID=2646786 RepID=UPI003ED0F7B4